MKEETAQKVEKWKEEVKTLKEVELFLAIESFGYVLWREAHDYYDGRFEVPESVFKENQEYYNLMSQECLLVLTNFGVDPASVRDPEGSYRKWYRFWKNWMEAFSDEEWSLFQSLQEKEEPYDHLLPKTKWNDPPQAVEEVKEIPDPLAESRKKLRELLQLPDGRDPLVGLKQEGWSDEEIIVIVAHFLDGGMLSEIIAPPQGSRDLNRIMRAESALRNFDTWFYKQADRIPGLKDQLIAIWAKKKNQKK